MSNANFNVFQVKDGSWEKIGEVTVSHKCEFTGIDGRILFESEIGKITEFTKEIKRNYPSTVMIPLSWEYMRNVKWPDTSVEICTACGKKVVFEQGMCKKCLDELNVSDGRSEIL